MSSAVIDARYLMPPEPMERVLEALPHLERGQSLTLLLHREPFPLYTLLTAREFAWVTTLGEDGTYRIVISHRP